MKTSAIFVKSVLSAGIAVFTTAASANLYQFQLLIVLLFQQLRQHCLQHDHVECARHSLLIFLYLDIRVRS